MTARLLNSQTNPDTWRKTIEPTQQLYSWAMNNHWHTNYRAYQEGPTVFRYVVRPHRRLDPAEASRFAVGSSQPLVATLARGPKPSGAPLFQLSSPDVLVTALKPGDDGKSWIIRLVRRLGQGECCRADLAGPRADQDVGQRHERAADRGAPWPGLRARVGHRLAPRRIAAMRPLPAPVHERDCNVIR